MRVLDRYAADLRKHESRLMLAEVNPSVREQLARTGIVESLSAGSIFMQTEQVIASLYDAQYAAEEWLARWGSAGDEEH